MPRLPEPVRRSFHRRPRALVALGAVAVAALGTLAAVTVQGGALGAHAQSDDAAITSLTATLLGHSQFARHPLDRELAGEFLDGYLDALDGSHALFLQSDVDGFARYRSTLAQATLATGDTSPAQAIFQVYLQRLRQKTEFVAKLLDTTKFTFTGHDAYSYDRDHAPWPKDLDAAKALWRQQLRAEVLAQKLADKPSAHPAQDLKRRYQQELTTTNGLTTSEVLDIYLDALTHVYDPHSDYLSHEQMQSLSIAMGLSLFGIGAALEETDGYCTIQELIPGGPAAKGGELKPGDRIVAVAQADKDAISIVNMPLSRAVELIRGPKGTRVILSIVPAGAPLASVPKQVTVIRDQVQLKEQEAKASLIELPDGGAERTMRIGVIDLPSFYSGGDEDPGMRHSASADVAVLLKKLTAEHVRGVVLDLRRNGGGSLDEAIRLTGLFIRTGPVVQTRGPDGAVQVAQDPDPGIAYAGPLVVLASRFSASASEILTGALKDYGRAVIVGDSTTFGKGTVQTVVPLAAVMDRAKVAHASDPGAIKLTIQKFYRPGGASTQLRGVASDIVLPSTSDVSEVSESTLQHPLPWDAVPPASFQAQNQVAPYLPTLRAESAQRIAADPAFAALVAEVTALKKNLATKTVSLNEAERRREIAEAKQRDKAFEQAVHALGANRAVTYTITVEDAAKPGLPPPVAATPAKPDAAKGPEHAAGRTIGAMRATEGGGEDVLLRESEHILSDYAHLMGKVSDQVRR